MIDDPAEDGRQFERTSLAHWRTTLAATVVALLIVRQAGGGAERAVAAATVLGALLVMTGIGLARQAALHRGDPGIRPLAVGGVVGAIAVMQVVALVVVT